MSKIEFKNWSFVRFLRLLMLVFVTFQAIETHTWWMLLLSAVLLYQVVINSSCSSCQTGSCELPTKKNAK